MKLEIYYVQHAFPPRSKEPTSTVTGWCRSY